MRFKVVERLEMVILNYSVDPINIQTPVVYVYDEIRCAVFITGCVLEFAMQVVT